jgi:hypothetical protein
LVERDGGTEMKGKERMKRGIAKLYFWEVWKLAHKTVYVKGC